MSLFLCRLAAQNSRFAPQSKYPWGAPRTPCRARLCATFDLIRGGLCPLELPLRKRTADHIERVSRQAERLPSGRRWGGYLRPRALRTALSSSSAAGRFGPVINLSEKSCILKCNCRTGTRSLIWASGTWSPKA